ncbi:poly-beta-1,6-N-acetyl-D-glucosamine synthase [Clostridium pasteurianum DSM 525 = ATCC 6013]|uniref:Poly-beta-1,6-N-acetyl-D-glucosamine synthase n=2 Tax=Clostridium pasteurianum TaxID=1501 RepID=A0A0H3J130_CLOPA|nr:glycosyltransferase [Clostridium pasteurianum]AJA47566.1 poly-beta-1,6-N-acetyl-D-glucosamine synthase [Clostridium pasteurianum DSM 525 = ATCC 6013]AJA51554.1 poly-beta-1,6-N-acetyl-D-glucosamine synthase [Clostridium pasteurianum DSM 525 = ATCC 6013]AOZ74881.1 glycosyl transferase [Clostridium pasteurianum DSM 525 = ATCC 6013]AOZ78676.1 glycosyl transferase [Clostridium pasteurianum]ELP58093.1 glycosyl transferase family protein [Clostridium pasteurianum DSM 525 = ATCC 6013]
MSIMMLVREIITNFNYIILYYVLCINSIYFVQLILSAFSLYDYIKKMNYSDYKKYITSDNMIPVSVLVPAYNEEDTIVDNIKSLLKLNYPLFEVVVINDGSKDDTLKKIIETYNLTKIDQPVRYLVKTNKIRGIYKNLDVPGFTLIDKENGGKADSLNAGINVSKYPVFTSIDADSILESDSLVRVIMPFIEDKSTVAVGGIVRIANGSEIKNGRIKSIGLPSDKLAMFQVVEYLRGFLSGRMGWDALGCLLIISGAFGAFKKDIAVQAGGYTGNTIGEDMELVVKMHGYLRENKFKYKIKFIPDPVCWTQAPEKIKDLKGQRRRWQIGLMDSLLRHKKLLLNPKYGVIGMFGIPYFWVFEMLGPIIEVLGYIFIPLAYIFGLLNLRYFILFLISSILYGIILSIGAILLEDYTFSKYKSIKQLLRLSWYGILENFGYRQMTTFFRVEAILRFKKFKNSWGKIKRKSFS